MHCKKCGTEQKEGQKFCPKCGTPYIDMEKGETKSSSKKGLVEIKNPQEGIAKIAEKEQIQELKNDNKTDATQPLNPNEEKKVVRMAKAGMWIILIAIVLTFVRAGFGFSFWWYVYLILFALVAASLFGVTLPESDGKAKVFDSNDTSVIRTLSWIGAIMLAILYLWGPLNSDYDRNSSYMYKQNIGDSNRELSWLQGTWVLNSQYGTLKISIDGDHIREDFGKGDVYYGTYSIRDGAIHPNSGSNTFYPLDVSSRKIGDGRGGYFRKQ